MVALLPLGVAGCAGGDEQLTVLAASSLTDAFETIELRFEAIHPDIDVVISSGGSSSLAAQIEQGVPADVFAAADPTTMARVVDSAVGEPVLFATNQLVIAVADGNPRDVTGLDDLARDDLVVVLADGEVPAGRYAAAILAAAGVVVEPASLEQNVRAVAAKVALGEADVAIVYATDVAAQRDALDAIAIPTDVNVVAEYPIVAVSDTAGADLFVEFVVGPEGRDILTDAGFGPP